MIIKNIKKRLEDSNSPVQFSIFNTPEYHVSLMGFKKGMSMKEHITTAKVKIIVLEGSVNHHQEDVHTTLNQYDEHEIAKGILNTFVANQDSLCLIAQEK